MFRFSTPGPKRTGWQRQATTLPGVVHLGDRTRIPLRDPTQLPRRLAGLGFSAGAFWAGISAFLFMVFGALTLQLSVIRQFPLPAEQAQSWVVITWLTASAVSLALVFRYRQPLGIGWTLPGLIYLSSFADRFSFQELVGANLAAGLVILLVGLLGGARPLLQLIPMPVLMGTYAAGILGLVTAMVEVAATDIVVAGPMVAAYLIGRMINQPSLPPMGLAVVTGAVVIAALGRSTPAAVELGMPILVVPGIAFRWEAMVAVTLPMVILVLGLGNTQGLGYLSAQGYAVPAKAVTVAIGGMTVVNALFGGHPGAMARASSAILAGPAAGPPAQRYWAAAVAFGLAGLVALATGPIVALVTALPATYIVTVGGLAVLGSFEDALVRAFSSGKLAFGAAVAFGVALAPVTVLGIPAELWAMLAGIGAALATDRGELLRGWRTALLRANDASG